MLSFILKRIGLGLITLWILSVLVFFAAQVLPGDPARAILGPLAAPSAVAALSRQLGTNRPVIDQYGSWIGHVLSGNLGTSYQYQSPVGPLLVKALGHSLELALVAFVIVVPLGITGGVVAALNVGKPIDRIISVFGLTATVIPEVVSGIVLILIFGIALNVLPISATWPPGAGLGTQIDHLIMPAIPLTLILFGYIEQMARAGTIEALNSDYARTATLKGLPRGVMIRRHILRNSLLPTVTVIATQTGYLIGGLVLVEVLFNYQGIGRLIYTAATAKDFPMLEAGVLV
ncbi:MAG: ABC transporter permease, partial [Solirubrobacteraceae bacterium]